MFPRSVLAEVFRVLEKEAPPTVPGGVATADCGEDAGPACGTASTSPASDGDAWRDFSMFPVLSCSLFLVPYFGPLGLQLEQEPSVLAELSLERGFLLIYVLLGQVWPDRK